MKSFLIALSLVAGLAHAAEEHKAVEVIIIGGIAGFDKAGYQAVRSTLSQLLAAGKISQFVTHAIGLEGGASFCVEASPRINYFAEDILAALKPIQIVAPTIYSTESVASCVNQPRESAN